MGKSKRDQRRWRSKERHRTRQVDPPKVQLGRERREHRDGGGADRKHGR